MVHQGLEKRLKNDGPVAGMSSRRKGFKSGLSGYRDILRRSSASRAVMSIGRVEKEVMCDHIIQLNVQTTIYVAT